MRAYSLLLNDFTSSLQTPPFSTKVPCYASFKKHLLKMGFTVYPFEFECLGSEHPYVDVAAKMGSMYWAFEYKSMTDSISRGVEQLRCYAEWFDYVVLVSEKAIDHRRSENYWELKSIGAGMWNYHPDLAKCNEISYPEIQRPVRRNHNLVSRRFGSYYKERKKLKTSRKLVNVDQHAEILRGDQSTLNDFFS